MAPSINYDLFWKDYLDCSELQRLKGIFDQLELSPLVEAILRERRFTGRCDWPVVAMLRALIAMSVLQHRSTESFRRELMRNPTLMTTLGFELKANPDGGDHLNQFLPYRVPSAAAFSRFRATVMKVEDQHGYLYQQFEQLRDSFAEVCPDFGERTGFDGKSIESHSTGRKDCLDPDTGEQRTSDPDAAWGCHRQYTTDATGKEKVIEKRWYGYSLGILGDVNYELPIDFKLVPANQSEHPLCDALVSEFIDSQLGTRCKSFVADRGLDSDKLRKKLHEQDILPVIDTRNLWQEVNLDPEQLKVPTRSLDAQVYDTMLRTECGDLYCRCPQTSEIRLMHYQGYESKRGTLKWQCPASVSDFECAGREDCHYLGKVKAGAKARVVRTKVNADNLRQHPVLPPATKKWNRLYHQRSAMERINSRVADGFMLHSHYLRGKKSLGLKVTISMVVMMAAANFAMQLNKPDEVRSLVLSLAA